jgi:hypothetical protein
LSRATTARFTAGFPSHPLLLLPLQFLLKNSKPHAPPPSPSKLPSLFFFSAATTTTRRRTFFRDTNCTRLNQYHHRLVAATTTTQQRKNGMKIAPGPPTFNKPKNSEITQELNLQPKKKKLGSRKKKNREEKNEVLERISQKNGCLVLHCLKAKCPKPNKHSKKFRS